MKRHGLLSNGDVELMNDLENNIIDEMQKMKS